MDDYVVVHLVKKPKQCWETLGVHGPDTYPSIIGEICKEYAKIDDMVIITFESRKTKTVEKFIMKYNDGRMINHEQNVCWYS